jgi:hypothetical protein
MYKKSLFLGAAALALLVLCIFVGCSNPTSDDGVVGNTIGVEGTEVTSSQLRAILADETPGVYALVSNNTTTAILGTPGYDFIPAGITLNLYGDFTITTGALTVGGNLNVNRAATLIANSTTVNLIIGFAETENNAQGTVTVRRDGRLTIDTSAAVKFANKSAPEGATGTLISLTNGLVVNHAISENAGGPAVLHGEADNARLILEPDSILHHTTPLATGNDATGTDPTALKNLANAKIVLNLTTAVTAVADLTIREGTRVATTAVFAPTGTLTVNGTLATATTSAIVSPKRVVVGPDGVLTTVATDTFAAVESVLVNGRFTANAAATFAAVGDLEVNGILTAPGATFAALTAARGEGFLTLGALNLGAKAPILFNIKNVTSAATAITAGTFTVPVGTTLTLTGAAAPTGNVVVDGSLVLDGSTSSLTIATTKSLTINGTVSLLDAASVVLASGATTTGAKIIGMGTLTAGNTDIVGGPAATAGWQAVFTDATKTITIAAGVDAPTTVATASITASAASTIFTAVGPGASITQRAGAGNSLNIATDTVISLGGTTTAAGVITLKNSPELTYTNSGKITFPIATTSSITIGTPTANTGPLALDSTYSTVTSVPAYEAVAVPFLHGAGTAAGVIASSSVAATASGVPTAGKLLSLAAGTGTNTTIIGGNNTADVSGSSDGVISADTPTQPTEPVTP